IMKGQPFVKVGRCQANDKKVVTLLCWQLFLYGFLLYESPNSPSISIGAIISLLLRPKNKDGATYR
ncbi:hypothetical protein, partial [Bacillus piscicola]|uniref:hypothetical protein n=1 Tax=Bacillus piscicola TaxID=1632684 RepID=UPI001F096D20